jgi:flavin reductase (DIM6/NTAB) family NADH-FMN oxidoreductase RutF
MNWWVELRGLVIGMPPAAGAPEIAQAAIGTILAAVSDKQAVGLFESYGGDDEPIDTLSTRLQDLELRVGFDPIRIKDTPDEAVYQLCDEAGTDFGQLLAQAKKLKKLKSLDADMEKALGRISSGLYIITARKGDVTSAMLASWVSQASFQPLGFTVAVAKDRAIESLMQVGDTVCAECVGREQLQPLMKTSRMEMSDHWLVYSTVQDGKVSNPDGLTAVHHRKVGSGGMSY